ncbi:MAG: hypothetical protein V1929_00200 [bacterium]
MSIDKIKIAEAASGLSLIGLLVDYMKDELEIFVDALDRQAVLADLAPEKNDDLSRELLAIRAKGHAMLNAIAVASENTIDSRAIMGLLHRSVSGPPPKPPARVNATKALLSEAVRAIS